MKHEVDAEWQTWVQKTLQELGLPPDAPVPQYPRGDVDSRRDGGAIFGAILKLDPEPTEVEKTRYNAPAKDGYDVPIFAYRKKGGRKTSELQPAILYLHGGGMIFGSSELFEPIMIADVAATGVAHFSVDYRVAPEAPHPTPVEDCYAALVWLNSNAKGLGIDNTRIAVAGMSAGGGLAAGVTLLARDRGLQPSVAKQILVYPMLDDRNTEPDKDLEPFLTWSYDDNWTGWSALLGEKFGSSDISPYAAPTRVKDFHGLPEAYIDVGTLDIFAVENKRYADGLKDAGVKVEWHLYPGVPHGFDIAGRQSKITKTAQLNRRAAIQSL